MKTQSCSRQSLTCAVCKPRFSTVANSNRQPRMSGTAVVSLVVSVIWNGKSRPPGTSPPLPSPSKRLPPSVHPMIPWVLVSITDVYTTCPAVWELVDLG
ncbi:hypothetical protein BaRGS_00017355 [Batillaria attramentaria]|uniref:Uncharacterized protein n=1 Tax=Batillaria attramentaria TaxID=370345 RepID=A0ABD0KW85_9CAEN